MQPLAEQTRDALAEVDTLRKAIGWGSGAWFLGPMLETGGCVVGLRGRDGQLVGMGATALFEPMGFVCNMVVRQELQRQGLGGQVFEGLLAWLLARGIEQIQLEATDEGKPLYERHGFWTRWESVLATMETQCEPGDEEGIGPIQPVDWSGIAALDRIAYGANRSAFLQALAAGPHHQEGLRLTENGRVVAFGFRYPGRIGPLVAATPAAGEKLARALACRVPEGTFAAVGHPRHGPMWERLGFAIHPFDVRMAFGPEPDDDSGMLFSTLNGGVG
jgi:GNAT superfamily N-acetyltransferase